MARRHSLAQAALLLLVCGMIARCSAMPMHPDVLSFVKMAMPSSAEEELQQTAARKLQQNSENDLFKEGNGKGQVSHIVPTLFKSCALPTGHHAHTNGFIKQDSLPTANQPAKRYALLAQQKLTIPQLLTCPAEATRAAKCSGFDIKDAHDSSAIITMMLL